MGSLACKANEALVWLKRTFVKHKMKLKKNKNMIISNLVVQYVEPTSPEKASCLLHFFKGSLVVFHKVRFQMKAAQTLVFYSSRGNETEERVLQKGL